MANCLLCLIYTARNFFIRLRLRWIMIPIVLLFEQARRGNSSSRALRDSEQKAFKILTTAFRFARGESFISNTDNVIKLSLWNKSASPVFPTFRSKPRKTRSNDRLLAAVREILSVIDPRHRHALASSSVTLCTLSLLRLPLPLIVMG